MVNNYEGPNSGPLSDDDEVFYDPATGRFIRSAAVPAMSDEPTEQVAIPQLDERTPPDYGDPGVLKGLSRDKDFTPDVQGLIQNDSTEFIEPSAIDDLFGGEGGEEPPEDDGEYYDDEPEGNRKGKIIAGIVAAALIVGGGAAYAKNVGGIRGGADGNGHALPPAVTSTQSTSHPAPSSTKSEKPPTSTTTKFSSPSSTSSTSPSSSSTSKTSSSTPSSSSSPSMRPIPTLPAGETDPQKCVATLPLDWRINQTLAVGIDDAEYVKPDSTINALETNNIGGVVVMAEPTTQTGINALKTLKTNGLFVGTDQEGGTVQRIKKTGNLPSAQQAAKTLTPSEYESLVQKNLTYLNSIGIDTSFAPVADIAPETGNSTEGATRPYSSDPKVVSKYVQAYVDGAKKADINPVMKHFPGMGRATANTDFAAATTPKLADLKKIDWQPYELLNDKKSQDVMVGTPVVPDWGKLPAALDNQAYSVLNAMGYTNGVKWTDSLNTRGAGGTAELSGAIKATGLTLAQATSMALGAGATEVMLTGYHGGDLNFTKDIAAIDAKVTADIKSGKFSEEKLNQAVLTDLGAKGLSACSYSRKTLG